jgi:AcrR family transcriptional regulator
MAGLRERKKHATRLAIHEAGMRLFAERGFTATTIDAIAEAADVSRATVFSYFPTKEEIVFGDAARAIDALAERLRDRPAGQETVAAVRAWLGDLGGWLEPDLILQLRIGREVPAVGARRMQLNREIELVITAALEAELGRGERLAARLAAASLVATFSTIEDTAVARMEQEGRGLTAAEIDHVLDDALAFVHAGIAAIATTTTRRSRP